MVAKNLQGRVYIARTSAEVHSMTNSNQVRYIASPIRSVARQYPVLNSVPCGQSLAGSGALVFEGELLEIAR